LLLLHDFVCPQSRLRGFDSRLVGLIGGPERQQQYTSGSDSKECHDPLCKRIARANERPDKPVPITAYLAVLIFLGAAGLVVYFVARAIVEPKE
jgi:hypothetical protein